MKSRFTLAPNIEDNNDANDWYGMVWTLFSLKYIRKYKMDVWELGPRGRNGYYAWPSHREKKRGEEKKGKRKGCPSLGKGEGTRFFLAFHFLAKQQ